MEKLDLLLRKTLATSTPDEVAFIYFPKERINKSIFFSRYGNSEIEDDGVTYSLTKEKLLRCFKTKTPNVAKFRNWTLSIPPCADRTITSIAIPSDPAHNKYDDVTAAYLPECRAETAGMTVVHFLSEDEADAFKRHIEGRSE